VVAQSHTTVENLLHGILAAGVPAGNVGKKPPQGSATARPWQVLKNTAAFGAFTAAQGGGCVVGGTSWDFADLAKLPDGGYDLVVVDEAGQFSLANILALAGATRRLLLLGDPQQLSQVSQGTHPEPVDRSALSWLTDGRDTLPDGLGYFLDTTWRMHPAVCEVVSRLSYENRLSSNAPRVRTLGGVPPAVHPEPVEHAGNATVSVEEAERVRELVTGLVGRPWADERGARVLGAADVLVVAAYNAQAGVIARVLDSAGFGEVQVGTVDRFQGKEAPVVIVSLAASSPAEVPRGMESLINRNRLNVALSRAQWSSYLVHSPALTDFLPTTPEGLAELGAFLRITRRAGWAEHAPR
jgi:uncharacterized protein